MDLMGHDDNTTVRAETWLDEITPRNAAGHNITTLSL